MRLSVQTDFALRTLMYLAVNDGHHSIADIADGYGISKNHLMKVAQRLAAEGFVTSVRGRGGGLALNGPAEGINIGSLVRKMEDCSTFVECFDPSRNTCIVTPACGLRSVLAGGVEAFMKHLDGFTLAHLIGDPEVFKATFAGQNVPKREASAPAP